MGRKKIVGGAGITAGGDVNISKVSGQFAAGSGIVQTQYIGQTDFEELRKSLLDFQKSVAKLNLSPEYQSVVNGDMSAAIIEAKEDKPALSKIRDRFESAINIIKKAGKTMKDISELYEPATKIARLVGIGLSFLP